MDNKNEGTKIKRVNAMDKQCIKLCEALNSIRGIETTESCCGHGKRSFIIFFTLDKEYFENLHIIARVMDRRYGGGYEDVKKDDGIWTETGWRCQTSCNDIYISDKFNFMITSCEIKGRKAYSQANKIAQNIAHHLSHKNYVEYFCLKKN